jgi:predicted DNA-binding helix-hairpin-helix protein
MFYNGGMNFKIAPDAYQKLSLLGDVTRFEPAGTQPLVETPASMQRAKPLPCISQVSTPTGRKPILKAMMTTACERNCYYCPFRAGRNAMQRLTFSADEMATVFTRMEQAGQVDGLFLSSGIIKGGVTTQDKIIDTAEILRRKHNYRGYIHLKIMPGAERDQIRRAMQLADRVSINLEGPTPERLAALAPKKEFWNELFLRIRWAAEMGGREHLRAGIVTQFVVGAVGDTDVELLQVSEAIYQQFGLRRAYYSAFHPILDTPLENVAPVSAQREFRLYQSSFLLRDYGWSFEELSFLQNGNLRLDIDPKLAWAQENLRHAPIEINRASRSQLLRVPGIGPRHADAILAARRGGKLTDLSHLTRLGVHDLPKLAPFVLLDGRAPAQQLSLL